MKSNKSFTLKKLLRIYLIIFSLLILFLIWFFQIIFLNKYYESSKTKEIKQTAYKLKNEYNKKTDLSESFNKLLLEKGICVDIISEQNTISSNTNISRNCISQSLIDKYIDELKSNNNKDTIFNLKSGKYNTKKIIYSFVSDDGTYFFLTTIVEPIDLTVLILKRQFLIVSAITLFLSFGSALFLAKKLSRPIEKINKTAKKVANGQYQEIFTTDGAICELNELADTLNTAKQDLAKTDSLRRDLLANVSHDLKTPLTMIKAYAEMVKDITYKDKNKRNDNLKVIIDEVDRLNILVSDILDLSAMQSNMYSKKEEQFDLIEMVRKIIDKYKIFTMTEDYDFVFETNNNKIEIMADKKKIEQVLYNLITNAINYTGKDKKVTIRITEDKKKIKVEIIDTGKGIKEEDLKKIWDKYYKNDKKHKRNMIGTGLGLSIVKNILEIHNYNYGVISEKNKGSNFYFEIPNQIKNKKSKLNN